MSRFYTNFATHMGSILLREVVDGRRVDRRVKIKPTLYVNSPDNAVTGYTSVWGHNVAPVYFDSVGEARRFLERYKDVDGFSVYGSTSFGYAAINEMYPGEIEFDPKQVCVAHLDIEVKSDDGFPEPAEARMEVTSIALSVMGKMHVFSCLDYPGEPVGMVYHKCADEAELLEKFLCTWESYPVDVLVGWNIDFFDLPYMVNRLTRVLGPDAASRLSPWRLMSSRKTAQHGKEQETWTIVGVSVVDYMRAYQKHTHKPQESYSLNHIAFAELGEKKLDYSEYASLNELYKNDPKKFIDYNVRDVRLVERLDEELGLIDLVLTIAYYCKITYDDTFGTVKMWENLIHNDLMDRKIVVPQRQSRVKTPFEGGHVKDVQTGRHDWVVSFDFDSLYPHLIMALNISPETTNGQIPRMSVDQILDGGLEKYRHLIGDNCVAGSCHLYSKHKQGFFPRIMEKLYNERTVHKKRSGVAKKKLVTETDPATREKLETEKKRYHNLQLAMKYALNSGYGAMSNEYFLWFDMRMAESVTLSGQVAIRWVGRAVDEYVRSVTNTKRDVVVAIDTDSIYVRLDELVRAVGIDRTDVESVVEFVDQACKKKISPVIKKSTDDWDTYLNAVPGKLKMKREKISESAIWTAKKKYAQLVWDDEGVRFKEPEMKFTGLEVVKSSTPAPCREKMKDAIKIMLRGTEAELQKFVSDFRREFESLRFEEIAFPRGVNGIEKYSGPDKSGVPIHTRAAIVYNRALVAMDLDNKYPLITDGDKLKYCHLLVPNPFGENVIACGVVMPDELGVTRYIDRNEQFFKAFVQPIKLLLDVIGWSHEKRASLSSFF